jgi:5,10-methylenetetrahydromethanopterin reductase
MYAPVVVPLDPSLRDQEWLNRGPEFIPDEALGKLTFAGTPADIVRQVEDLVRAGVTRVEFGTPHGLTPEDGIRLLGERVLPWFSAR